MTDQLTNTTNIPLSLSVWLAHETYDHSDDPNTISATSLLKPMREIVLSRQNKHLSKVGDVSSLIASSMGNALHTAIEVAWSNKEDVTEALNKLGYPKSVTERVIVNPTKEQLTDDCIPVYMEQRVEKQVGQYKVTGKFDFVLDGILEDFKSTQVYSYLMQSNKDKYIQQGSIYRWLNPDIITSDVMAIQYIFTDWNKLESIKKPEYPKTKMLEQKLQLMPIKDTERFVINILNQIDKLKDAPQEELPKCSSEELWISPTVWKYYKDPNKTSRSTKNFNTAYEAQERLRKEGSTGIVKEIRGKVKKCTYCSVSSICKQAQEYVNTGQLTL